MAQFIRSGFGLPANQAPIKKKHQNIRKSKQAKANPVGKQMRVEPERRKPIHSAGVRKGETDTPVDGKREKE